MEKYNKQTFEVVYYANLSRATGKVNSTSFKLDNKKEAERAYRAYLADIKGDAKPKKRKKKSE